MKKLLISLLASSTILFTLVSCSNASANNDSNSTINSEIEDKTSLTFPFYRDNIADTNPHLYHSEMWVQEMLFETLVTVEANGIEPGLAESWDISEDGKVYTFKIREGVTFSDGEILNAHAIKANFDALWDNKDRHTWLDSMQLITNYYVEGDYTFIIELSSPYYPLLTELGVTRPFAMASPKAMKDGLTKDGLIEPIGSGPYMIDEYVQNEFVTFVANENYWGEQPEIKNITMKIIPDNQTRLLALESGEIDLIYGVDLLDATTLFAYEDSEEFTTDLSDPLSTRHIVFNSTNSILKDEKVRYALSHAIDKTAISEGIFYGLEPVADYLYSPTLPYCNIDLDPFEYDVELANKYLDEAGWVLGSNGIREKDGQKLELSLLYDNNSVSGQVISEFLQSSYLAIGIDIELEGLERNAYLDALKIGDFDIAHNVVWGSPYDPQATLASMRAPSHGDYAAQLGLPFKEDLDNAITEVLLTNDEESRQELYDYIITTLHDSAIYLPLTYENNKALYSNDLTGVDFKPAQYTIPFWDMSFE